VATFERSYHMSEQRIGAPSSVDVASGWLVRRLCCDAPCGVARAAQLTLDNGSVIFVIIECCFRAPRHTLCQWRHPASGAQLSRALGGARRVSRRQQPGASVTVECSPQCIVWRCLLPALND
jgi:hypothetical protein